VTPSTWPLAVRRAVAVELRQCRAELDRLRGRAGVRVPVVVAVVASVLAVAWGNGTVVAGRRLGHDDAVTLVAVPALAAAGLAALRWAGWTWRDLGLGWPSAEPPRAQPLAWLGAATAVAVGGAVVGLVAGPGATRLAVVRLVLGTAAGEEVVHRSVLLALWAATPVGGRAVVAANVVTFGAWHVAAATHADGLRWWEAAVPAGTAVLLLWARLRFRSVLAPVAFHAGGNLPGLVASGS
jgi:membrane protease YdiL (CAAX protease family)